jgi:hypothetical protein
LRTLPRQANRSRAEDIFGIPGGKEKFDHQGGGHARWLEKIHAIRLAEVTPARAQEMEAGFHRPSRCEHSIGDVQIDPELMRVFQGYAAQAGSGFVINHDDEGDPEHGRYWDQYRAKEIFERLSRWLRAHGVTARKPIHELRKEFGSMVNRKQGLSAASDQLRHSGIATTAAYYIDRPRKATSGIGPLLVPKRKGKKIVQFKDGPGSAAPGVSATRRTVK